MLSDDNRIGFYIRDAMIMIPLYIESSPHDLNTPWRTGSTTPASPASPQFERQAVTRA